MQDWQILRRYVEQGSEAAFAQLVERHLKMVYSVCLRELNDATLAEDATQGVFLLLAHKASVLRPNAPLAAWLFQTARLVAKSARRQETRRRAREQKAAQEMIAEQSTPSDDALWQRVEPFLNDALSALGAQDRAAILLRFFEGSSLAETGAALGVTEDAARMRVTRAIGKIRKHLAKQGVPVPTTATDLLLTDRATRATPALSSASVVQTALKQGELPNTRPYQLEQGALREMRMTQLKTTALVAGVGLAGLATFPLMTHAVTPGVQPLPPALVRPIVPQAPPAKAPREVETTVYLVEVRASALARATQGGTPGHRPNGALLESLRKAGAVITSVPTIRTLEDVPGKMTQTAQASPGAALNGPLQKNNASLVTSVETKPHVNPNGSLTIALTVTESEAGPAGAAQKSDVNTSTTLTVKSGETMIVGGTSSSPVQRSSGKGAPSEPLAHIILLTATLVPDEHNTQPVPAART